MKERNRWEYAMWALGVMDQAIFKESFHREGSNRGGSRALGVVAPAIWVAGRPENPKNGFPPKG